MTEKPTSNRWFIAIIVVMLSLVEVLDITIVSVALQNMKGALAAAPDQITWTITAYVVSAAIVMPLTGLLSARYGRKKMLVVSAYGFTFSSFLCGLSHNLWQMVLFRACQGAFGALLPPLAQATLADTFRGKDLSKAMALYGVGLMVGPILGPILGGYISDDLGWRYVFFINIPIGIVGALLAARFLPETPKKERPMDLFGLFLLALGIGSLQYVLDRGNELAWFASAQIVLVTLVSFLSLLAFVIRGWGYKNNVIDFKVLHDKNFSLACLAMLIYFACFLGTLSWMPLWLELFLNYPASIAGLSLMPRGVACLITILISARLTKYVDARYFVMLSTVAFAMGVHMLSSFNLEIGSENLILPNVFMGIAVGLFFVPLNDLAYQSLPTELINEASGFINFCRSMGGSIGVSMFTTLVTREAQINWHQLGANIHPFNPALHQYVTHVPWLETNVGNYMQNGQALYAHYSPVYWGLNSPRTIGELAQLLNNHAYMVAYVDANYLFSYLALLVIPLLLLMNKRVHSNAKTVLEA